MGVEVGEGGWKHKIHIEEPFLRESQKNLLIFSIEVNDELLFLLKETMDQNPRFSSILMKNDLACRPILDKGRNRHVSSTLRTIGIAHIIPRGKPSIL